MNQKSSIRGSHFALAGLASVVYAACAVSSPADNHTQRESISPSSHALGQVNQSLRTLAIPSDREIEESAPLLNLPTPEHLLLQQNALEEITARTFSDERSKNYANRSMPMFDAPASAEQRDKYRDQIRANTKESQTTDLLSVAKQFQRAQDRAANRAENETPVVPNDALLIFVSFAMPDHVISNLSEQARTAGATLILRGLKDGSLKETKLAAHRLNRYGAAWEVNPQLFSSFKIETVPTFVLTGNADVLDSGCPIGTGEECSLINTFASVRGDLSVELALETIRTRTRVPYLVDLAREQLNRMAATRN